MSFLPRAQTSPLSPGLGTTQGNLGWDLLASFPRSPSPPLWLSLAACFLKPSHLLTGTEMARREQQSLCGNKA